MRTAAQNCLIVFISFLSAVASAASLTTATLSASHTSVSRSAANTSAALTQQQVIEFLIEQVRVSNLTFIRNNTEHPSAEAADHLKMKYQRAGKRIKTAQDFIKYIASSSSISKDPYKIKFADGRTTNSGDWLNNILRTRLPAYAGKPQ